MKIIENCKTCHTKYSLELSDLKDKLYAHKGEVKERIKHVGEVPKGHKKMQRYEKITVTFFEDVKIRTWSCLVCYTTNQIPRYISDSSFVEQGKAKEDIETEDRLE